MNSSNSNDPNYVINIPINDYWYKIDSTYLILVMGDSYLSDKSATYVVSFTTGESTVILLEDVPYSGVVVEKTYNYYMFPIHFNHEDVTISLQVFSGDPDLYISFNPQNPTPTIENYDVRSARFSNEAVTIIWENGLRSKCPDLPDNYKFGDKTHCFLYIGVYGYRTSTYSIRIHPAKDFPIMVSLGVPQSDNMNQTEYRFYYTIIDTNSDLHVLVQPLSGDPDLFLNVFDKNKVGDDVALWERPTKFQANYSSQSSVMSEDITIPSSQLKALCKSLSCVILASVFCSSEQCFYSLTMNQNQVQRIKENQATYGFTGTEFLYYTYYCDKDDTDFLVTVTPLNDGNPDLYISKGRSKRPDEANYTWKSTGWGGDSILITKSDKYFEGKSMKGTYVIGVHGSWGPVSFSLIINNNPVPIINLISGVPQYGNLTANNSAYYIFDSNIKEDILVTLTPTLGRGKLSATSYYSWQGELYTLLDTFDFFWNSNTNSDRYSLLISTSDTNFCTYCSVVIKVTAETQLLTYSIQAKNNIDITILQNGIPNKFETKPSKWSVFSFEVLRRVDFDITLTAYTGHPGLFVSTSKNVTWENFIWESFYIENTLNLQILKTDANFKVGTYYLVVNSYEVSSYSIVAHTRDSFVSLVDGWPISYSLKYDPDDFVNFRFSATSGNLVFCNLQTDGDYQPIVYSKFQSPSSVYSPPNEKDYDIM